MLKSFRKAAAVFLALSASAIASAADVMVSSSDVNLFDAGRIQQNLRNKFLMPLKPAAPIQQVVPPPAKPEAAGSVKFKLNSVLIKGNTVFELDELYKIVKPYVARTISLTDLQRLVADITHKYRSEGYILSRAILPPQTIENGVVTIQIVEGFISKVMVKGEPGKAAPLIQRYGDQVVNVKPLRMKMLEHYMLLANDVPGVTVRAILTASKTTPAAAELALVVQKIPGSAYATYDNYGTRFIGPNQVTVGGNLYSLLAPGDNNTVRAVQTTRGKQLHFYEYTYSRPIGLIGMTLALGANYAQTKPGFTLEDLDIIGRSATFFADLAYSYVRTRQGNIIFHGIANYQNVTSTLAGAPFYQDRIRSFALSMNFDRFDGWHGIDSGTASIEHGLPLSGARDHFYQSRPNGQAIFTKTNLSFSRLQAVGPSVTLLLAAQGQFADMPLLATEQFGFGGSDFGRGYDPSEIVGDKGIAGKIELRLDRAPGFKYLQSIQYYAFYDAGVIWNNDVINLPFRQSATSTGLGARFSFIPHFSGNFFAAKPLTKPVATQQALNRNVNGVRMFFQLVASS